MRRIVFIQLKLPTDIQVFRQVALRWEKYGEILQNQESSSEVWIFAPNSPHVYVKVFSEFRHIKQFTNIEFNSNLFSRYRALQMEIKQGDSRVTLVCGDNQQSLIMALFLKLRLRSKVGVQIQFHGDTYSFSVNRGLKGFFRALLSRVGIVFADSIRIVSKFQEKDITAIWHKAADKFVLAPIPIDESKVAKFRISNKYDLAFIGRLHSERGIVDLIDLVKTLKSMRPETSIAIAGNGPLRKLVAEELAIWIADSSVSLRGFLNDHEITNLYSETKVLVSTAPREGYGLTLREAILSNVPVIARQSEGALETKAAYPEGINTFTTIEQAVELIMTRLAGVAQVQNPNLIEAQIQSDVAAMKRLTNAWLTL